jgi:predicted nucleic acid-binding protein
MVFDASAALSALLNAGPARLWLALAGVLDVADGGAALEAWSRLGVLRYPSFVLAGRVWELRDNVAAYGATYVALAEHLGCALLTADRRLAGASGLNCAVTVVPR